MNWKIVLSGILISLLSISAIHASSDTDILLDLLVKKGVLTKEEADSTKKELEVKKAEEAKKLEEQTKKVETKNKPLISLGTNSPITLSGYLQLRYQKFEYGNNSFDVRKLRVSLDGKPDENWDFRVFGELAGGSQSVINSVDFANQSATTTKLQKPLLIEAWARYKFNEFARLQAGQLKLPFSYESWQSDADLDFIDRAQVVDKLAPGRDNGSLGRDIGVVVDGHYTDSEGHKWVEYAAGVVNGNGINTSDDNKDKDFVGRAVVYPIKSLSLGLSGYKGRAGSTPTDKNRIGGELNFTYDPVFLRAEYITGTDNTTDKDGWYIAGGYKFIKELQAVARYESYDPNTGKSGNRTDVATVGLNWFMNTHSKLQLNYEYKTGETGDPDDVLTAQYQLKF